MRFTKESVIRATPERVFAFHELPDAFERLMPPWETSPSQPAAFLGFHFILSPPQPNAIVSRLLLTIELTTTAIAGLYLSFLFRSR